MNQKNLLQIGIKELNKEKINDFQIKAKQLLLFILNETKEEYIINLYDEVNESQEKEYISKINEIIEGKPLQYITNKQEFMGIEIFIDENVLIPQPDTEILVEETIKILEKYKNKKNQEIENLNKNIKILDLCTGSGAIAVSISKKFEKCEILATDVSKKAIEIAKININKYNLKKKIKLLESNMFENIDHEEFDFIISNPPYIETNKIKKLDKEVKNEPFIALNGGADGLQFYKEILEKSPYYLKKGGYILFEIGYNQGKKIINLYDKNIKSKLELITKEPIKDFSGNDRVMIFKKIN